MKALLEVLLATDPQALADAVIREIACVEKHADRIKGYVFGFLEQIKNIEPRETGMILFGFKLEGAVEARIAELFYEDPDNSNTPVTEIESKTIAEYVYETEDNVTALWPIFLGMRVDFDTIRKTDLTVFLATIFNWIYLHDYDEPAWNQRVPKGYMLKWLQWIRKKETKKVSRILKKHIPRGRKGKWRHSTEGISRYIQWVAT